MITQRSRGDHRPLTSSTASIIWLSCPSARASGDISAKTSGSTPFPSRLRPFEVNQPETGKRAPEYAEQRVAYLPHLLQRLALGTDEDAEALAFLMQSVAPLAHERSPEIWRGLLVQNGTIRYHPHSLRIPTGCKTMCHRLHPIHTPGGSRITIAVPPRSGLPPFGSNGQTESLRSSALLPMEYRWSSFAAKPILLGYARAAAQSTLLSSKV